MRETEPNPVDAALAAFLESPVMIIVGSCDDGLMPQIARAAGAIVDRGKGSIDLIVSGWQWPQTIANVRRNGRLAVTFARPADYVSYQVKGRAAVIPVSTAHRQCAQNYIEAMTRTFVGLGLDRAVAAPWLVDLEPQVLRLAVEMIFVQTPGEKAGRILEPSR
jgi:pyridoxamine 5'-phosphate oxidase-like protein